MFGKIKEIFKSKKLITLILCLFLAVGSTVIFTNNKATNNSTPVVENVSTESEPQLLEGEGFSITYSPTAELQTYNGLNNLAVRTATSTDVKDMLKKGTAYYWNYENSSEIWDSISGGTTITYSLDENRYTYNTKGDLIRNSMEVSFKDINNNYSWHYCYSYNGYEITGLAYSLDDQNYYPVEQNDTTEDLLEKVNEDYSEGVTITFKPYGEKITYSTKFAYQGDDGIYVASETTKVSYDVVKCDKDLKNFTPKIGDSRYVKAWLYNGAQSVATDEKGNEYITETDNTNYNVKIFVEKDQNIHPTEYIITAIEGWGNLPVWTDLQQTSPYIKAYLGYTYNISIKENKINELNKVNIYDEIAHDIKGIDSVGKNVNYNVNFKVNAKDTPSNFKFVTTDDTQEYAFHNDSDFEGKYYGIEGLEYYALNYGYYISAWKISSVKRSYATGTALIDSLSLSGLSGEFSNNKFTVTEGQKTYASMTAMADWLDSQLTNYGNIGQIIVELTPTWKAATIKFIESGISRGSSLYDTTYSLTAHEQDGQTEMFAYTTEANTNGDYTPEGKETKHNIIALNGVFNYKKLTKDQVKHDSGTTYKLDINPVYVDNIYRVDFDGLFAGYIFPTKFTSEEYDFGGEKSELKETSDNATVKYFHTKVLTDSNYTYQNYGDWASENSQSIEDYTKELLGWKDKYISMINGGKDDFTILQNVYTDDAYGIGTVTQKDDESVIQIQIQDYYEGNLFIFLVNNQTVRSLPSWENTTSFVTHYTDVLNYDYKSDRFGEAYAADIDAIDYNRPESDTPSNHWEIGYGQTLSVNYFRKYILLDVETLLDSTHGRYGYVELEIDDEINTSEGIENKSETYRVYFDSLDRNENVKYVIEKKNLENSWSRYETGAEGEQLIEFNEIRLYSGCSLTVKVYDQSNIDLNELKDNFSSAVGYTFNNTSSNDDLKVFRIVKSGDIYIQTGNDLITADDYASTLSGFNNYNQGDRIKITVNYSKINYNFTITATAGHVNNLDGNGSVTETNKTLHVGSDLSVDAQFHWGYGFTNSAFTLTNNLNSTSFNTNVDITSKMGNMNSSWLLGTYYAERQPASELTQNATIYINSVAYSFDTLYQFIIDNTELANGTLATITVGNTFNYGSLVKNDVNLGYYIEYNGTKYAITSYGLKQQDGDEGLLAGNLDCEFLYKTGEFSEKITSELLGNMFSGNQDLFNANKIINEANRKIVVVFNLEKLLTVNVQVDTNGMNAGFERVVVTSDNLTSTFTPTTNPVHYSYVGLENTLTANYNSAYFDGATYWYYTGAKQDTIPASLTELQVDENGKFKLSDTATQYNIVVKLKPAILDVNVSYKMANRYSDSYASLGNATKVGDWIYKSGVDTTEVNKIVKITYEPNQLSLNDVISWSYEFGELKDYYDIEVVKVLRKNGTTNYIRIDNPYILTVEDFTGSGEVDIWFILRPWPTDDLIIRFVPDSSYKFDASVAFASATLKSNGVEIASVNLNGKTLAVDFTCKNGFEYAGKYIYDNIIYTISINPINGVYTINLGEFYKPDTNSAGKICTIYVKPVTVFVNVEYEETQHKDSYLVSNTYDITKAKNEIVTTVYQDIYLLNDETKHQDEVFNYFYYMNGTEEFKLISDADGKPLRMFEITSDMLNNAELGTYNDSGATKSCYTFKLKVNTTEKYALNYATTSNFDSNETLEVELKDSEETELNGKYYFVGDEFAFALSMQSEDAGKYKLYTVINGSEQDVTAEIVDNTYTYVHTMQAEDTDITFKIVANELAITIQEFDYIKLSEMQNPGTAQQTSLAINGVALTKGDYKNSITLSAIYSNSSKILRKIYISGNDFACNYVISYNNNSWELGTYTKDGDVITETYEGVNLLEDLIEFKEENGRFNLTYVAKGAITVRYDYADYKTIS